MVNAVGPDILEMQKDTEEAYTYGREKAWCAVPTLGRGYIGARIDTTQQTNICLGIHRQTRVATFNPTSLSSLLAIKGLLVLSLLILRDVNST